MAKRKEYSKEELEEMTGVKIPEYSEYDYRSNAYTGAMASLNLEPAPASLKRQKRSETMEGEAGQEEEPAGNPHPSIGIGDDGGDTATEVFNRVEMEEQNLSPQPAPLQRRVSSKQRKLSLEEYRQTFMQVPHIEDRKPVFVSREVRDRLDEYVRRFGRRKMSVSGLLENMARHYLALYEREFEQWKRL